MFRTLRFYHSFFKFLSTPSSRRATGAARHHATVPTYFYPRPPRGGRPKTKFITFGVEGISIHALREEGDFGMGVILSDIAVISIHALREEGDMRVPNVFVELAKFLSTPSARRATVMGQGSTTLAGYFYPRPPRGGRPCRTRTKALAGQISIHALREEGDFIVAWLSTFSSLFLSTPSARRATQTKEALQDLLLHFYPRPPRGGRRLPSHTFSVSFVFLSTPSARRATCRPVTLRQRKMISIHALREEGDHVKRYRRKISKHFYPRPPRGGRLWDMLIVIGQC